IEFSRGDGCLRWSAITPRRGLLVGVRGAEKRRLLESPGDQLKADREPALREAAWQGDRGHPREARRRRVRASREEAAGRANAAFHPRPRGLDERRRRPRRGGQGGGGAAEG